MTFDRDFCYFILFSLPSFLGGKRKGGKNKQSRGEKSCLSARSLKRYKLIYRESNAEKKPWTAIEKTVTAKILSNSENCIMGSPIIFSGNYFILVTQIVS